MLETLGGDSAVAELIGSQVGVDSQVLHTHVDLRHQQRACHRRRETCHEKCVVAARIGPGNRAACIAPESIGDQPFVADGSAPSAAGLSAENQGVFPQTVMLPRTIAAIDSTANVQ